MNENSDLGYSEFFEVARTELGLGDFAVARVTAEHKGSYKVKNKNDEYLAKIRGKQMFSANSREDYPAVGDWVAIVDLGNRQAVIEKVLPRKTVIKRKAINKDDVQIIATNIDVAFIVESVNRDYNLNRFERYFSIAKDGGIKPIIILNKIDLISEEDLKEKIVQIENRFKNVDIISTSTESSEGINELEKYIEKGKTYCFLGSSGVGKSSLINQLIGKNIIKTENIGDYSGRGKHVTTSREMYFLENGGILIDNPGVREVGMTNTETGISDLFDEITNLAKECKYSDCTHIHEPECRVLLALEKGELDKGKYDNYITLKKESDYYNMSILEKKEKNRQFGKFVNKVKKDFKIYKKKNY